MLYIKKISAQAGATTKIKEMKFKEIDDKLGLIGDRPVHNLLKRERKRELQDIAKQRGRKPAKTL